MTQRLDGVREANSSPGSLLRYPSFRRAVCVDALVRICAGAIREDRPYRDSDTDSNCEKLWPRQEFDIEIVRQRVYF
jgi:hypothetical protein